MSRRALAPAAIGAGVLGVSILGVLAVRGAGDAAPTTTRIAIASQPPGAAVVLDGELVGATPRTVDVTADRTHAIELRKPGYLPLRKQLDPAGGPLALELAPVSGFDGVWQLPDGRLRRFKRTGDRVDVYARDAVAGTDGASRTYEFGATERGVAFAGTEIVPDERSADPSCRIAHGVEYRYQPGAPESLTVALERVGVAVTEGRCVVTTREPGTPIALRRVDQVDLGAVRYSEAPIGLPPLKSPAPPQRKRPPQLAHKDKPPIPNDTMDNRLDGNAARSNAEIAPQPQAPPPNPETQAPVQQGPQQQPPSQPPSQAQRKL